MPYTPLLNRLIDGLKTLPGVGPRSAQRMAFHLLERDRNAGRGLAAALSDAMEGIGECRQCRMFTESEVCAICADPGRDRSGLCIVETPADVMAVEQSTPYRGRYFVLMGHLSPLDGIGPDELGLDKLERLLAGGDIAEVILATNPTVEGEATARYVADLCEAQGLRATRIAHGVPVGGELEFVDSGTLAHAFAGRQRIG